MNGTDRLARDELETRFRAGLFAHGIWRVAGTTVTAGNRVRLLHDGPETFDAMLRAIDDARMEISLESYIVRDDVVGARFAAALEAAAARGVQTRLLSDWLGSRDTSPAFWRRLQGRGVEVRIFSTPGWRPWLGLVPRDHRKLLVVDGRIGITGGFGLGIEWDPTSDSGGRRARWRDTAAQIEGPAALQMAHSFDTMWRRAGRERGVRPWEPEWMRQPPVATGPLTDAGALVGIIEGVPWKLRIARVIQVESVLARHRIWIATAYFIPSPIELAALSGAARDGVDVRLLLPDRNDHPWVTRLARRFYPRLLRSGVRIWEWGGAMMHAKTGVMDGRWVRVGSTDLNPAGIAINYELDAIIEDGDLGRDAELMFLEDLEQSREITHAAGEPGRGYAPLPDHSGPGRRLMNTQAGDDAPDSGAPAELRRIVIGADFHESASEAAPWVMRHLAPEAEHELVHVLDIPELPGPLRSFGGAREQTRMAARRGAEDLLEAIRGLGGHAERVNIHLLEGKPAREIVQLAEDVEADLIVVGEQGPRRGVGALLASTAERVLFDSPIPVLVARKLGDAPPRRLLVAIDDSEVCDRILEWARYLLGRFAGCATVLNVVDRLLLVDELTGFPSADALRQLEQEAVEAMQGWLEGKIHDAGLPASQVRAKVVMGDPSYEIIADAGRAEADLVLIGSRGGDVARTPLIGRVVNKVVRTAPCSVLVVTREAGEHEDG